MNASMKQNAPIDSIRLSKISDPKFAFGYAIMADGKVLLKEPTDATLNNLRSAIDFARCHIGENPFCIKCKNPLNEEDTLLDDSNRFYCPKCKTAFNWK